MLRPSARLSLRDLLYKEFSRPRFNELLEAVDIDSYQTEMAFGRDKSRFDQAASKGSYMLAVLRGLDDPGTNLLSISGRQDLMQLFLELVLDRLKERNPSSYDQVRRLLASEGVEIGQHGLQAVAGRIAKPVEEENSLFDAMRKEGLDEVIRCLEQSHDNFLRGSWEASNAMTRTALDTLVTRIAESIADQRNEQIPIGSKNAKRPQPTDIRKYLKATGFLDGNEFNLLDAFYQFCSTRGSHPGLSDESDCRLRRFMLVGLSLEYLEKFSQRS